MRVKPGDLSKIDTLKALFDLTKEKNSFRREVVGGALYEIHDEARNITVDNEKLQAAILIVAAQSISSLAQAFEDRAYFYDSKVGRHFVDMASTADLAVSEVELIEAKKLSQIQA